MAIVTIVEPCRRHGDKHCRRAECEVKLHYRRERVEQLLVARWNDGVMFQEQRAEPDMAWRKAPATDPRRSTDIWAELLDLDRAWEQAELSPEHRAVLGTYYGDGVKQKAIATVLGVDRATISRWLHAGVSELMFQLNGRWPAKQEEESEEE